MHRYQSHKIVEAAKVIAVHNSQDAEGEPCVDFELEDQPIFSVTPEVGERVAKMAQEVGKSLDEGYLVNYVDEGGGYISWSPGDTFDAGYNLVQPSSGKSAIKGYRELTEAELRQMNNIKECGVQLGTVVEYMRSQAQIYDQRWVSIGATELQQGLMSLTRAVAKPDFF